MVRIKTEPRFKTLPPPAPVIRNPYRKPSGTTNNDPCKFVAADATNWVFNGDNDDLLSVILGRIESKGDRKSVSLVCKQWLRIEGMNRKALRVIARCHLPRLVTRFPNIVEFHCSVKITNKDIELVARAYPKLQVLDLNGYGITTSRVGDRVQPLKDVSDDGLISVSKHCKNLVKVVLRWRQRVSDSGLIFLLISSKNLVELDLGAKTRVTDETFAVLGSNCSLKVLNLGRSSQITLEGFMLLANGAMLSRSLVKLVMDGCNGVTDEWFLHMKKFSCLEELNLAFCGRGITDVAGEIIASIRTLKSLDIKYSPNITDVTLFALAKNCPSLVSLDVSRCLSITGEGLLAFVGHSSLERLNIVLCIGFTSKQIQELVIGCKTLRELGLDAKVRERLLSEIPRTLFQPCQMN